MIEMLLLSNNYRQLQILSRNYLMKILNFIIKMLQQEITKSLKMSEKMKISEKKKNYKIDLNEASEIRTTERTQI